MKAAEAKKRLQQLLAESRFDRDNPDPLLGWQVFKQFVLEPVEAEEDGVLFQIGIYKWTGTEQCHLDFVRQFTIEDEDGPQGHMEQLHLLFLGAATDGLRRWEENRWAEEFPSLEAFFAEVESLESFQAALAYAPWRCEVSQEEV